MDDGTFDELIFRPHALGYLIALGVILGIGAACLSLAAHQHPAWLVGAVLMPALGVKLAYRYAAAAVVLRGMELVFSGGLLTTHEVSIPIWEARLEIRQSLLDRLLDSGSITHQAGDGQITARVGQLRLLRQLIAVRRGMLLGVAQEPMWAMGHARELAGPTLMRRLAP